MIETNRYVSKSYPPYNIIETDENKYLVELAVAGFSEDQITVEKVENRLVIMGRVNEDLPKRKYIHKGIATRVFEREFILNDNVDVVAAHYKNGVLSVELVKIVPEEKKPKRIAINGNTDRLRIDHSV